MEGFPIVPDWILANKGVQSSLLDSQLEMDCDDVRLFTVRSRPKTKTIALATQTIFTLTHQASFTLTRQASITLTHQASITLTHQASINAIPQIT